MYTEFLIIYILLGVMILLAIVGIILLIALLKKTGGSSRSRYQPQAPMYQHGAPSAGASAGGVAFCKNCGAQFNASLRVCPRCGSPR